MTLLHWRDNMSLGIEAIDDDHKSLIELLNRLHYMIRAGDEHAEIERVLDDLRAYCERHFGREEELMERCGYPERDAHQALHRDLEARLETWTRAYQDDPDGFDASAFYDFVSDWLLVHVLEEDMKLKPHITEAAVAEMR